MIQPEIDDGHQENKQGHGGQGIDQASAAAISHVQVQVLKGLHVQRNFFLGLFGKVLGDQGIKGRADLGRCYAISEFYKAHHEPILPVLVRTRTRKQVEHERSAHERSDQVEDSFPGAVLHRSYADVAVILQLSGAKLAADNPDLKRPVLTN